MVIIRTTFGEIKLELDAEKAPKTVGSLRPNIHWNSRNRIRARLKRHLSPEHHAAPAFWVGKPQFLRMQHHPWILCRRPFRI